MPPFTPRWPRWMCACWTAPVRWRSSARSGSPGCSCAACLELAAGVGRDRRHLLVAGQVGPHLPLAACECRRGYRGRHCQDRDRACEMNPPPPHASAYAALTRPGSSGTPRSSAATRSGCWSCGAWPASSTIWALARGRGGGDLLRRRSRSPRRGRPRAPARAGRASAARARPARARPGPAVRSSSASSRGSWARRPGALRLDERVGLVGEQRLALPDGHHVLDRRSLDPGRRAARRPRRARARCGRLLDARGRAHRHQPRVARRVAQGGAQGQPPAERVAAPAAPPPRPRRSRASRPSKVCSRWSSRTRRRGRAAARATGAHAVAGLHEAGDEQDRWSHRPGC